MEERPLEVGREEDLQAACERFVNDPSGFARFMFDWGEGALKDWSGMDWWHEEVFATIKEYLEGPEVLPLQIAIASGHGAAKTAFVAVILQWFMSCRPSPQVVCTANTETQLNTKTWRELAKWHKLAANHDWFEWTATSFYDKSDPATWKAKKEGTTLERVWNNRVYVLYRVKRPNGVTAGPGA